jgi:hypothetical protein
MATFSTLTKPHAAPLVTPMIDLDGRLQRYQEHLEDLVNSRTAELEAAQEFLLKKKGWLCSFN